MTIEELKIKKKQLEQTIFNAVSEFEKESGVSINSIDITHMDIGPIQGHVIVIIKSTVLL